MNPDDPTVKVVLCLSANAKAAAKAAEELRVALVRLRERSDARRLQERRHWRADARKF